MKERRIFRWLIEGLFSVSISWFVDQGHFLSDSLVMVGTRRIFRPSGREMTAWSWRGTTVSRRTSQALRGVISTAWVVPDCSVGILNVKQRAWTAWKKLTTEFIPKPLIYGATLREKSLGNEEKSLGNEVWGGVMKCAGVFHRDIAQLYFRFCNFFGTIFQQIFYFFIFATFWVFSCFFFLDFFSFFCIVYMGSLPKRPRPSDQNNQESSRPVLERPTFWYRCYISSSKFILFSFQLQETTKKIGTSSRARLCWRFATSLRLPTGKCAQIYDIQLCSNVSAQQQGARKRIAEETVQFFKLSWFPTLQKK